ncbi:uncharacterized protein MYCGRDRAFT_90788 [Zymoseptoria tritici IPO323]|uniref:Uncharacterized protein n=1 Tax=Zymoseptoria tritici (strain CBS 115943 / IPO323) TaxID=336722 RepID=F9X3P9_ZYMTI|nr:uncharacterized protein MYCGRDRAFT_90788 [Zymoseptoria tritici IPO323]EGP89936.1 hypothetical protein MYCGRDRAFT_90788 [Zymoseptoria tritici IPO323]
MLSLFRTLLLALAAATATLTTASPLPLPKQSSSIAPHSQSCTARAPGGIGGELLKYDVRIGRVYDQNKCKAARKALRKSQELGAFSSAVSCVGVDSDQLLALTRDNYSKDQVLALSITSGDSTRTIDVKNHPSLQAIRRLMRHARRATGIVSR